MREHTQEQEKEKDESFWTTSVLPTSRCAMILYDDDFITCIHIMKMRGNEKGKAISLYCAVIIID